MINLVAEQRLDGAEILPLALATRQQQQTPFYGFAHPGHGGQGRPHVGGLGVVDPAYPIHLAHEAGTVRQTFEAAQHGELGIAGDADRIAQGHGCQGVGLVVGSDDLHLVDRQQWLAMEGEPLATIQQAAAVAVAIEAETLPNLTYIGQGLGIVTVDQNVLGVLMDLHLGGAIVGHALIAIHMIFGEVEHHGGRGAQAVGGLQLEAGELQYAEIHRLLEQLQCRCADITAHTDLEPSLGDHLAHQGGHRTLAVGAGDGDDRHFGVAHEQLDVADDLHAALGSGFQLGSRQGDARTRHYHVRLLEQLCIEPLDQLHLGRQLILARRVGAGVHHQRRDATTEEVIDAGESGFTQSDDDDHGLSHLQGGKTQQHQHEGDDPEAHDDARLRPALLLVVVMDRRHAEDPHAAQLVGTDLQDHRDGLHHEDPAHDHQQELLAHQHGDGTERAAQCQGAHVPHKHLGRIGVEPEKAQTGPDDGGTDDHQLGGVGHIGDMQIAGEVDVTGRPSY